MAGIIPYCGKFILGYNLRQMSNLSTETDLPPISLHEQLQLANQLYDRTHLQIRAVDDKIRALFAANTLLAAALAFTQQSALPDLPGLLEIPIVVASVASLLATVSSVIMALLALIPRVYHEGNTRLFFFGSIATQTFETFRQDFLHLEPNDALQQILEQIHVLSRIALIKNQWLQRAAISLMVALVMWFTILTTNLIAHASSQF
jgi:hypothetical protein